MPNTRGSVSLAELLRRLRSLSGATLRKVAQETGVSNAYLSQLETGSTAQPAPHFLHALATFYHVPYESLMEAAGYLKSASVRDQNKRQVSSLAAALMSAELSADEERQIADFIEFVRAKRKKRKL